MVERYLLLIDLVEQAMRMTKIEPEKWLEKEISNITKRPFRLEYESEIIRGMISTHEQDSFFQSFTMYKLSVENSSLRELLQIDFEVNLKQISLAVSLTDREKETLQKRIVQKKSITQTASEMGITPQGVVAFMRSIKKKTKRYFL